MANIILVMRDNTGEGNMEFVWTICNILIEAKVRSIL